MKLAVHSHNGTVAGEKELPQALFAAPINKNVLYEALKHHLANKRQGTSSVKTVRTVHGTTSKPWRQKGTGRARAGTNKSPLWKGGGVIFGPHPRDYRYKLPKKIVRAAYTTVFSMFAKKNKLIAVEDVTIERYKTREVAKIFTAITRARKVLYIAAVPTPVAEKEQYEYMRKSAANLPWLKIVNVAALEIKDLYYADEIVLSTSAIDHLTRLGAKWSSPRREGVPRSSEVNKKTEGSAESKNSTKIQKSPEPKKNKASKVSKAEADDHSKVSPAKEMSPPALNSSTKGTQAKTSELSSPSSPSSVAPVSPVAMTPA